MRIINLFLFIIFRNFIFSIFDLALFKVIFTGHSRTPFNGKIQLNFIQLERKVSFFKLDTEMLRNGHGQKFQILPSEKFTASASAMACHLYEICFLAVFEA